MSFDTNSANDRLIRFPFGKADEISITADTEMAIAVNNTKTVAAISELGAAGTIDAEIHPEMPVGAELHIKASADGTARVLTLGDGLTGNAFTVTANKSAMLSFVFDGTSFVNTASILTN